jgi:hypothetical protein
MIFLRDVHRLLVTNNGVPSSPNLVTVMMEALSSSETWVITRATRRNIAEGGILLSSTRNFLWVEGDRPVRKDENITAISEPIFYIMYEPRRLTSLWSSKDCYRDILPRTNINFEEKPSIDCHRRSTPQMGTYFWTKVRQLSSWTCAIVAALNFNDMVTQDFINIRQFNYQNSGPLPLSCLLFKTECFRARFLSQTSGGTDSVQTNR